MPKPNLISSRNIEEVRVAISHLQSVRANLQAANCMDASDALDRAIACSREALRHAETRLSPNAAPAVSAAVAATTGEIANVSLTDLFTVEALSAAYPILTVANLRWQLRHRDENGLAFATILAGKKLLISRSRYEQWLAKRAGTAIQTR